MRPWVIVLSSMVLALAAAAAVVRPELTALPHAAMLPHLLPMLPTLVVTVLAIYALCAILLTSINLVVDGVRVRHLLRDPAADGAVSPDWTAAFERSGFRRLVPPPALLLKPALTTTVVLQGPFRPHEARREVGRLYYIAAARAHFFSALIVLSAAAVLGAAQSYRPMPFLPGPIPAVPAALAVAGLVLLAILARIAVDVAAEPLIGIIARLPAETIEAGLLRRTAELLEKAPDLKLRRDATAPVPVASTSDRLGVMLEQGQRSLFEAIERLSTTTDGLASTTRSSIEALETACRATPLREQTLLQNSAFDGAAINDLRDAVVALTAILQSVRDAPVTVEAAGDRALAPRGREPDLALELRKLLHEIETTR